MIQPNHEIPVTLTAMQWNAVLAQLDEGPHRVMRLLIDSIRDQCMAHDPERQQAMNRPTLGAVVPFTEPLAGE
jgi:hypothetical protein